MAYCCKIARTSSVRNQNSLIYFSGLFVLSSFFKYVVRLESTSGIRLRIAMSTRFNKFNYSVSTKEDSAICGYFAIVLGDLAVLGILSATFL